MVGVGATNFLCFLWYNKSLYVRGDNLCFREIDRYCYGQKANKCPKLGLLRCSLFLS